MITDLPEGVMLRDFAPGDTAYVMSTWLRDLRDFDPGPLPDDLFFAAHRPMVERLLASPTVRCTVAAAADAPGEILGYAAAIPEELLVWIHVRKPLRRRGLAKLLLQSLDCPPGTPAAWATPLSKLYLRNPARGRSVRGSAPFALARDDRDTTRSTAGDRK